MNLNQSITAIIRPKSNPFKTAVSAATLLSLLAASAFSQEVENADKEQQLEALEEIVVTGSRIKRDGFSSPVPLTVMGGEYMEAFGINSIGEAAGQLPSNSQAVSPANVGAGNFDIGSSLANLRGLNPFFGTRTLTLVDGKRFVPATAGGAVDLNLIPGIMLERIEIVTGGASAAYGSDAVAGVMNVILDKQLEGIKLDASYGETSEGDGQETKLAIAGGTDFMDGRGRFVFGFENVDNDGIGFCDAARDWCAKSPAAFTGNIAAGDPNFIIGDNATLGNFTQTGVFPGFGFGPDLQYNAAGTALIPFDPGNHVGTLNAQGGDSPLTPYSFITLMAPVERNTLYSHVEFGLSDSLKANLDISYGKREAVNQQATSSFYGGFFGANSYITPDNYYINNGFASPGPFGGALFRENSDIGIQSNNTENETYRMVAGLEGQLNEVWSWDGYVTYGENEQRQRVRNAMVTQYASWSLDVVDDGFGNPVCRATLLGSPTYDANAAGCEPMNAFGMGNVSPEAAAYVFRTQTEDFTYEQTVIAGNGYGQLPGLSAGNIALAFGLEYRYEEGDVVHDNIPYSFSNDYGADYSGESTVVEGYLEMDVPLLKAVPGVDFLALNLAVRNAEYENKGELGKKDGNSTTWKASLQYDPNDWFHIRATQSKDVRAPSFRELYTSQNQPAGSFFAQVNNPWAGGAQNPAAALAGGTVDLKPEQADTTTFGFVVQPANWAQGIRLSLDYYQIELNNAISALPGSQSFVDQCFANPGSAVCDRVTGWGTANITLVDARAINVDSFESSGYDFEGMYTLELQNDASMMFRVLASYADKLVVTSGGSSIDYAGQSGPSDSFGDFNPSPKWRGNAIAAYKQGAFSANLQFQYVGSGKYNATYTEGTGAINTINDNSVDSVIYTTFSSSYRFDLANDRSLELYGVINNLMDEDPPVAPGGNGFPTNPTFFDTLGRRFTIGIRAQL